MTLSVTHNLDCLFAMREAPDNHWDLAICDPPYGGTEIFNGSADYAKCKQYDNTTPSQDYFAELFRVSVNQIICGGNYFSLPPTRGIVFWNKDVAIPNYSAGELLWTSFSRPARYFFHRYTNIRDGSADRQKINHPTAKPVALYKWLLQNYAQPGDKIFDSHLGSGSSRIAAHDLGFDFTGYELDKDYFDAQEERFQRHIAQGNLFEAAPLVTTQEQLFQ
jgi:site-specific DNA-methyltransferase (adenine-specific)